MFNADWSHPREHIVGSRKGLFVHLGRFCVSRHCRDLFGIAVLAGFAALFGAKIAEFVLNVLGSPHKAVPGLLQALLTGVPADSDTLVLQAGLMTVAGGVVSWAYQAANTRFGVVDIFAAEIATLCRVAAVSEFIPHYVQLYDKQRRFPVVNAPRDYLAVFNNNARDLEVLDGDVARFVTQFYVHMKATQDSVSRGADPQENPLAALNVIYSAFLAFESARQALAVLMDRRAERREYLLTVMLSEIPAYLLLYRERKTLGGLRTVRIEERLPRYRALIDKIDDTATDDAHGHFAAQLVTAWRLHAPPEEARLAALEGALPRADIAPAPASVG